MSNADLTDIAAKIAAIEALANGGATEGEIAAATAAINRLLTRYNITIERARTLAGEADRKKNADTAIGSNRLRTDDGKRFEWEIDLAHTLATAHYCKLLLSGRDFLFIGRKNDAQTAMAIYSRLRDVLAGMATRYVQAYSDFVKENTLTSPKELKGSQSLRAVRLSYLAGAVQEISNRLYDARKADDVEYNGEVTALVVVTDAAITEFLASWKIGAPRQRGSKEHNAAAYKRGREDGKSVSLHRADLTD